MEANQNPDTFWRLTPRVIATVLDGAANRLRREHNERAWLAWHIEALARAKKLPKLKDLVAEAPKRRRRQTPEEMEAIARSWMASRRSSDNSR